MLSSRHVGLQGGCVGVGCLVSDTPGAPHGVACSWTAAMQGRAFGANHPRGARESIPPPAHVIPLEVGLCTIGSRLSIPFAGPRRAAAAPAARLRSGRVPTFG